MKNSVRSAFPVLSLSKGKWVRVGVAFRQTRGGGWNVEFEDGIPSGPLVLADAREFQSGESLRLFVTRPSQKGGSDWFEVGSARVSQGGRGVVLSVNVRLPRGEHRLVVLPPRR